MAGRRRRPVKREANGRTYRDPEWLAKRKREEFFGNQPHRRGCTDPLDSRLGYQLGRLFWAKLVNKSQHEAGERWLGTVLRYKHILGLPDLGSRKPPGFSVSPETDEATIAAVRMDYDKAHAAIVGPDVGRRANEILKVCRNVCIRDCAEINEHSLECLRIGLDRLISYYQVGQRMHPFGWAA